MFFLLLSPRFRFLSDNVASIAMGKSARRSIKSDDPSSPSSSPYIYYHSTSRPESYQLWSPSDYITTRLASTIGEALRYVHVIDFRAKNVCDESERERLCRVNIYFNESKKTKFFGAFSKREPRRGIV